MPPKRALARKRQTKLAFSSVPASSPGAAALSPQVRERAAAVSIMGFSPSKPMEKRKLVQLMDSDDDSDSALPTPKRSFRSMTIGTPSQKEVERRMMLGMPAHSPKNGMFGASEEHDLISSESSEDEPEPTPPSKTTRASRKRTQRKKSPSPPPPPDTRGDSTDSEHMPDTTPPPSRRGRQLLRARKQRASSFEVPDDEVESEESEEETAPRNRGRQRNTRQRAASDEDDAESEEEAPRTPGRRLTRNPKQKHQEKEDLAEDLEFLQSSPLGKNTPKSSSSRPMNARQKALAALKARRGTAEPSSSATPGRNRAVVLSDSDSDLEIIPEEKIETQDDISKEDEGDDNNADAFAIFQENEGDSDFIDDEADLIGAPAEAHVALPIAYSGLASAKPRELFQYAVEWMVQKKINPAFSSTDEVYDLAFRKLDDEVNTLANSKFSSSIWTPDFLRTLRARPDVMIDEISKGLRGLGMVHCEACNRKTHPATWNMSFDGKPYDKETLEPLADDDDDDDDGSGSDSDTSSHSSKSSAEKENAGEKPTHDVHGEVIAPTSRIFTLGSTCKANAQMAHTLHHWRYHLNSWVVDYIARQGHLSPENLVKRDKWSERKRGRYANRIVRRMEKEGEIRKLHRLYRDQIDYAMEARNEYRHGWGRR